MIDRAVVRIGTLALCLISSAHAQTPEGRARLCYLGIISCDKNTPPNRGPTDAEFVQECMSILNRRASHPDALERCQGLLKDAVR